MKSINVLLILLAFALGVQAQFVEHNYDFNDLELGNLDGQDGWSTVVNAGGTSEMQIAETLQGISSYDGTKAVFYGQSGGNMGRTGSRESEENFPFDFTQGGTVEIEVDIYTGWWGTLFGFGYDANNNGYLMKTIETVVNIENNEGGFGFHIARQSQPNMYFYMPDGSTINFIFPFASAEGWFRHKFFVDLDANDGAGSVSLFVKEMDGSYVPITEITDLNLGMEPGSGTSTDPATWSKIFLHGTGATSAFDNLMIRVPDTGGLLYQYLTFTPIGDHLSTDAPFSLEAVSSQGLEVLFEVTGGPATINGNVLTITGEPGTVEVAASQPGNSTVAPAEDVIQSFEVIDPSTVVPVMEIRNAVEGETVRMPELMAMPLVVAAEIEYPDLLSIAQVQFTIDGNTVNGYETKNGFYIGNWTPPSHGFYTVNATVISSGGVSVNESVTFEIVSDAPTMDFEIVEGLTFGGGSTIDTSFILPSFVGTYSQVTAILDYGCPCTAWDLVADVSIRGANGEWMELFKYITPYGVACDDEIDITDFVSQLQGKVDFKLDFPQSVISITFHYEAGTPEYSYSWMDNLWQGVYPFGNYANLQPVGLQTLNFSHEIEKAHIRLMCSGHGWGDNNTGNAAEFYDATHNINLNGNTEFQQHLWQACNPNPVGCMPQNGTWYHNRHGWCPGTIPMLWQYDITQWITIPDLELQYEFYPGYVDLCNASHPDCESGVTCPDCNSTSNPKIDIGGGLVTYSNAPLITSTTKPLQTFKFEISPNPTSGAVHVSSFGNSPKQNAKIQVLNITGTMQTEFDWDGGEFDFDLGSFPKGVYLIRVITDSGVETKKLILN